MRSKNLAVAAWITLSGAVPMGLALVICAALYLWEQWTTGTPIPAAVIVGFAISVIGIGTSIAALITIITMNRDRKEPPRGREEHH